MDVAARVNGYVHTQPFTRDTLKNEAILCFCCDVSVDRVALTVCSHQASKSRRDIVVGRSVGANQTLHAAPERTRGPRSEEGGRADGAGPGRRCKRFRKPGHS